VVTSFGKRGRSEAPLKSGGPFSPVIRRAEIRDDGCPTLRRGHAGLANNFYGNYDIMVRRCWMPGKPRLSQDGPGARTDKKPGQRPAPSMAAIDRLYAADPHDRAGVRFLGLLGEAPRPDLRR